MSDMTDQEKVSERLSPTHTAPDVYYRPTDSDSATADINDGPTESVTLVAEVSDAPTESVSVIADENDGPTESAAAVVEDEPDEGPVEPNAEVMTDGATESAVVEDEPDEGPVEPTAEIITDGATESAVMEDEPDEGPVEPTAEIMTDGATESAVMEDEPDEGPVEPTPEIAAMNDGPTESLTVIADGDHGPVTPMSMGSDAYDGPAVLLPATHNKEQSDTTPEKMGDDSKPTVELFVRAAPVDKEDKGPCPISQQWFMAFYILVEKRLINLRVTPINLDQPPLPANYSALDVGRRLPVAWVEKGVHPQTGEDISRIVADTNDAIEDLIDLWQCPNLAQAKKNPAQRDAEKASEDLYKHFNLMLKDGSSKPLEADLKKLDDFLGQNEHRYMLGDELCYADCMLMPKLQHIRVAGKTYKEFELPSEFKNVWKYIESMYATQAFFLSCPADCDILFHYMDKAKYPKGRKLPTLMSIEEKLNSVPDEVNTHTYKPLTSKPNSVDGQGE